MTASKITFLYPTARQFDFDPVCERIVRELEARNWQVPGIEIKFDVYGSGEQKLRLVRSVKGADCSLYFCRVQRLLPGGRWNDVAGADRVSVPRQHISVYDDHSGPTYFLYVGDQWEQDRDAFHGIFASIRGEVGQRIVAYTGACFCHGDSMRHTHRRKKSPYMVSDGSKGCRKPRGDEPLRLSVQQTEQKIRKQLEKRLLAAILAHPVAAERIDAFPEPEAIPFPKDFGTLFAYGDGSDRRRVNEGRKDASKLIPADRFGLRPDQMLAIGATLNGYTPPAVAKRYLLWCGAGQIDEQSLLAEKPPTVPGKNGGHYDRILFRIRPNRANEVYVADNAAYEESLEKSRLRAMRNARSYRTDQEVAAAHAARMDTLVAIADYRGGYKQPLVLFNREVDLDEVEVVGEVKEKD